MAVFRSRNDDSAFIVLSDEVREHVRGHFGEGVPGSRFVMQSPDVLLQMVLDEFSDAINGAVAEADGRKRVVQCGGLVTTDRRGTEYCTYRRQGPK